MELSIFIICGSFLCLWLHTFLGTSQLTGVVNQLTLIAHMGCEYPATHELLHHIKSIVIFYEVNTYK